MNVLDLDGSGSLLDRPAAALAVLERMPHSCVVVLDRDLRYLLAAGEALVDNGYDPEVVEGRHASDVISRERWIIYEPLVRGAFAGQPSSSVLWSEDRSRAYQVHVHPLGDDAG